MGEVDALHFVEEAYKHCKPIAADKDAIELLKLTYIGKKMQEKNYDAKVDGVIIEKDIAKGLIQAMKQHRFWEREKSRKIPA